MKVKIMQWVRTAADKSKYTASTAIACETECENAVAMARDLDRLGDLSKFANRFTFGDGEHLAVGCGVTIVYQSGRRRTVRA